MPDHYEVEISIEARRELRQIHDFIARRSPQNASAMAARLLNAMHSLEYFPHRYDVPRTRYSERRSIRAMAEPPYIIRPKINEADKTVFVLHVRHGSRKKP